MIADSDDSELQVHDDSISVELLSLIAALSLEDVDEVYGRRKGKAVDGPPSDEELALQLFAEEAYALQVYARDIELAQSIANAELLAQYAQIEDFELRDREAAIAMSRAWSSQTDSQSPTAAPIHATPSRPSATATVAPASNQTSVSTSTRTSLSTATYSGVPIKSVNPPYSVILD